MNELALFAGGGGGLLGSKLLGWRAVCYVENNPYCVQVIQARIRDGYLDDAPIWDDVRTFDGHPWTGRVDIITGGFPCQPFSFAGRRLAESDGRNLWPDTLRIVREVRPEWVFLENVPGLLSRSYIRRIFADLAEAGYVGRWDCISAAEIGAPHLRERLWILAHAKEQHRSINGQKTSESGWSGEDVAHADISRTAPGWQDNRMGRKQEPIQVADAPLKREGRLPVQSGRSQQADTDPIGNGEIVSDSSGDQLEEQRNVPDQSRLAESHWWDAEPGLGRVADGMAHRVDRLRAIGNGQVPAVVRAAWNRLGQER